MNTYLTTDSIESAYCFLHQKWRVYEHSTSLSQRDDIEYAIASYAESMNRTLYSTLARDRKGFLFEHTRFADDMLSALKQLETLLPGNQD